MGTGAPQEAIEWAKYIVVFLVFLVWWKGVFAGGICEKWGADGGFLMVNSWWNAGGRWWESDVHFDR
jgi:hypothetical protein